MFPVLSSSDALPSSQRLSSPLALLSPSRSLSSSQSLHPLYSSPLYDSSFNHQPILSPYFPQNAFSQFSPSFSVKQPGVLQSVKFPFQRSQLKPKEGKPADASQPPFLMHLNAQPSYALPSQFPVGAPREPAADAPRKAEAAEEEFDAKSMAGGPFLPEESKEIKSGWARGVRR